MADTLAALPRLQQQIAIVTGAQARFESSLFDIKKLVQADLFDSEIDAAKHLLSNHFHRAAGALAGVVLETHLGQVAESHKAVGLKKHPSIADINETLKSAGVIDISQWRFIQHLADIRNLCDHKKSAEPKVDQVQDLVSGVEKIVKTIF